MSQLFDPDTYRILAPYPHEHEIVRDLEKKVVTGELTIPPNRIPDYKVYLKELAKEQVKPTRVLYQKAEAERDIFFRTQMEEEWSMKEFPQSVKNKIHSFAWNDGHAYGYSDVSNAYEKYVELAEICLAAKNV